MAWERRKSGTYYYEKKRVNGKTVSIYWGNGELAHARAEFIQLRRDAKIVKRLNDKYDKDLLDEVRLKAKHALEVFSINLAQLYRLKGRRVPKVVSRNVARVVARASSPCVTGPVSWASSPSVSGPSWPCSAGHSHYLRNLDGIGDKPKTLQHNQTVSHPRECEDAILPRFQKVRNLDAKSDNPEDSQHNQTISDPGEREDAILPRFPKVRNLDAKSDKTKALQHNQTVSPSDPNSPTLRREGMSNRAEVETRLCKTPEK